ncbi:hypothetical protein, partial [Staphylococcus aureus]
GYKRQALGDIELVFFLFSMSFFSFWNPSGTYPYRDLAFSRLTSLAVPSLSKIIILPYMYFCSFSISSSFKVSSFLFAIVFLFLALAYLKLKSKTIEIMVKLVNDTTSIFLCD